jgi:hypothetical protein
MSRQSPAHSREPHPASREPIVAVRGAPVARRQPWWNPTAITCAGVAQLSLDLGKATFDNTASSLGTLQGLVEDRFAAAVRDVAWIPTPVSDIVDECIGLARRTRADVTSTADRCYALLCTLVTSEP